MVHADASNFSSGISKGDAYTQVLEQAEALMASQRNWVCNTANTASLLWHAYKSMPSASSRAVNWAGFYVLDPSIPNQLLLGPFHGKVACQTIAFARGVCGAAARTGETQVVEDVLAHVNHIACDSESRSEIVVPVWSAGRMVGVIDVDSTEVAAFGEEDRRFLETLAGRLGEGCDW